MLVFTLALAESNADAVREKENEHFVPPFIDMGTKDSMCEWVMKGFPELNWITECELHVYNEVPHSFGMTDKYPGARPGGRAAGCIPSRVFGLENRIHLHKTGRSAGWRTRWKLTGSSAPGIFGQNNFEQ